MKRPFRVLVNFIVCALLLTSTVLAKTSSDVKKQAEKTQSQIEEATELVSDLEETTAALSDEIESIDMELVEVLTSISICEDEIALKEQEISIVKSVLDEAKNLQEQQYKDMKKRIQFMYEKGDAAYLQVLVQAASLSDMLNKAAYIDELYAYDRELLEQYATNVDNIKDLQTLLEEEELDLLSSQHELPEVQEYLENLKAEKQATMDNFEEELAKANAQVSTYKAKLEAQTAEIKELEEAEAKAAEEAAKKAEEEAKAAEAAALAAGSTSDSNLTSSGSSSTSDSSSASSSTSSTASSSSSSSTTSASSSTTTTTTTTSSSSTLAANVDMNYGLGSQIAAYACQFIGNPYVYGGTSLTNGTDCSGFTQSVYAYFGYTIPRDSTSQRYCGTEVSSVSEAQPGDIVCYAGHVGLYIGNGLIVHASSASTGIKVSYVTYRTILSIRRII